MTYYAALADKHGPMYPLKAKTLVGAKRAATMLYEANFTGRTLNIMDGTGLVVATRVLKRGSTWVNVAGGQ